MRLWVWALAVCLGFGCGDKKHKPSKPAAGSGTAAAPGAASARGDCKKAKNVKAHEYKLATKFDVGDSKMRRVEHTFEGRGASVTMRVRFKPRFPKKAKGKLPVVIWSHGGGPTKACDDQGPKCFKDSKAWGKALAQAGYVVLAVDHDVPSGCRPTKEGMTCNSDGVAYVRGLCKLFGVPGDQCFDGDKPRYDVTLLTRPLELATVLSSLADVSEKAPFDLDLDAVALGGWSAGNRAPFILAGATPLLTAPKEGDRLAAPKPLEGVPPLRFSDFVKLDVQPKAIVGMAVPQALKGGHYCKPDDPGCCLDRSWESKTCGGGAAPSCADGSWESQSSVAGVRLPMLLGTGSGDCKVFGGQDRCPKSIPTHRRRTFDGLPKGDKYLLYFHDPHCDDKTFCRKCATGHGTFNLSKEVEPCPDGDCRTRDAARRSLRSAVRAFLDWHVRKRPAAKTYLASDSIRVASDCHAEWARK